MADKRKNGFYDHKSLKMCFANRFERYNLEINFLSFIWSGIDTYLIPSDTHFSHVLSHNYSPPQVKPEDYNFMKDHKPEQSN